MITTKFGGSAQAVWPVVEKAANTESPIVAKKLDHVGLFLIQLEKIITGDPHGQTIDTARSSILSRHEKDARLTNTTDPIQDAENQHDQESVGVQTLAKWLVISVINLAVIALALAWFGQPAWCACGNASIISLDVWSSHNSQHAIDPYSITHVSHGLLFFVGLLLISSRLPPARRLSSTLRFGLAAIAETSWEILENTPLIINRYREATISLDYFGDSITNSCFDLIACLAGYLLANRLGWRLAIALFLLSEIIMLAWIRDSLLLNVIMLSVPIDAIRDWQNAIAPS